MASWDVVTVKQRFAPVTLPLGSGEVLAGRDASQRRLLGERGVGLARGGAEDVCGRLVGEGRLSLAEARRVRRAAARELAGLGPTLELEGYDAVRELRRSTRRQAIVARHRDFEGELVVARVAGSASLLDAWEARARAFKVWRDPQLAYLFELRREPGSLRMVRNYIPGESLARRLAEGARLEPGEALRGFRRLARSLTRAHSLGLSHGKLTSSNLIVCGDDLVLTDFAPVAVDPALDVFGLARLFVLAVTGREPGAGGLASLPEELRASPLGAALGLALAEEPGLRLREMGPLRDAFEACEAPASSPFSVARRAPASAKPQGRPEGGSSRSWLGRLRAALAGAKHSVTF